MAPASPDWYSPDSRWPALGFATREAYAASLVITADFHAGVPVDIVEAYNTAAHLMALAWYHYPLYDEAIRKLTGMVEMGVKLRCQHLGIATTVGVTTARPRPLAELIEVLCRAPEAAALKAQLHRARSLRNSQAHPEHQSFGGIAMSVAVVPLVQLLNDLFAYQPADCSPR